MTKKLLAISSVAVISLLCIAPSVHAGTVRSGTDDYLREVVGFTDQQLSSGIQTENREPFMSAAGEQAVADPSGDVLDRNGAASPLEVPWADLTAAELARDDEAQEWILTMMLAETMQDVPSDQINFLFYADNDGMSENNAPEGVRGGMDQWYALVYEQNIGWKTNFRWYNTEADFWGMDKETAMAYTKSGDTVTFTIPYAELPRDTVVGWRAAVAVSRGSDTQIDVAPGIGFPPPKGESYPTSSFEMFPEKSGANFLINGKDLALLASAIVFITAAAYAVRIFQKNRKQIKP